jgi:hypothetical protein
MCARDGSWQYIGANQFALDASDRAPREGFTTFLHKTEASSRRRLMASGPKLPATESPASIVVRMVVIIWFGLVTEEKTF